MSSSHTTTTFGDTFGALTSKRGGALALRASSSVIVGGLGSGIGNTVRSICCDATESSNKLDVATSKHITGEFFIRISDFIVLGLPLSVSLILPKSHAMPHLALDVNIALRP